MEELLNAVKSNDLESVARLMRMELSEAGVRDAVLECINTHRGELLAILLDNGASPDLRLVGQGWTLMQHAIERQNVEALGVLLDHQANHKLADVSGWTPLHHSIDLEADSASQSETEPDPTITLLLLAAGADATIQDKVGQTPLDIAREYDYTAAIAALESSISKRHE